MSQVTTDHPNMALIQRIGRAIQTGALSEASADLAGNVVWHYFNPRLPDLAGDYAGLDELPSLFQKLGQRTDGTFTIEPVSAHAVGEELVVTHVRISLLLEGNPIRTDAVVIWRVLDSHVVEVWDIPAVGAGPPTQ